MSGDDLYHIWGQDLVQGASGGFGEATGTDYATQRVIRRLMTVPGDDPYNPTYGAGLSIAIGDQMSTDQITGVITTQMKLETAVDQTQPIIVAYSEDDASGSLVVTITYVDAETGGAVAMSPIPLN